MTEPTDEEIESFIKERGWKNYSGVDPTEWKRRAKAALVDFRRRENARTRLLDALKKKNIQIDVGGCGCCDSPSLKVIVDGELICDEGNFNFSNTEDA